MYLTLKPNNDTNLQVNVYDSFKKSASRSPHSHCIFYPSDYSQSQESQVTPHTQTPSQVHTAHPQSEALVIACDITKELTSNAVAKNNFFIISFGFRFKFEFRRKLSPYHRIQIKPTAAVVMEDGSQ